jgi:hypothetical protein
VNYLIKKRNYIFIWSTSWKNGKILLVIPCKYACWVR